jgi:hypothetical protein
LGNPAVTNADGNREIQLRNVIPKHYLSDHFQRLWTRPSFFATIESALISGKFLFQSSVPNRQLIFAGLIFPLSGRNMMLNDLSEFFTRVCPSNLQSLVVTMLKGKTTDVPN